VIAPGPDGFPCVFIASPFCRPQPGFPFSILIHSRTEPGGLQTCGDCPYEEKHPPGPLAKAESRSVEVHARTARIIRRRPIAALLTLVAWIKDMKNKTVPGEEPTDSFEAKGRSRGALGRVAEVKGASTPRGACRVERDHRKCSDVRGFLALKCPVAGARPPGRDAQRLLLDTWNFVL
jgi:hypothetical protein